MLRQIGKILKTHGFDGTMLMAVEPVPDEALEALTELFIVVEGLNVPFPIEDLSLVNDDTASLNLEFVNSPEEAAELLGCNVMAEIADETQPAEFETIVGFELYDRSRGYLGKINQVENFAGNIVMQVTNDEAELLIPLHEHLIRAVDEEKRTLTIETPDGLLDVNTRENEIYC